MPIIVENYDESIITNLTIEPYNIVRQHHLVAENARFLIARWQEHCDDPDPERGRCERCWTRKRECYCVYLNEQRTEYKLSSPDSSNDMSVKNCEVVMYYAPKELGRTPNTAHIFEELLPYCSRRIVLGDEMAEQRLIAEMIQEFREGRRRTCIMYPNRDAMLLSQWVEKARASRCSNATASSVEAPHDYKIRLIALDGTYSNASRLYKHLQRCLTTAILGPNAPENEVTLGSDGLPLVPVVKLDLGEGGLRSAMAGIMRQPAKDKMCTYQAVVMAMQQLGESPEVCTSLHGDLDKWIEYILKSSIKLTKNPEKMKRKVPVGLSEDQHGTADYVRKYVNRNVDRQNAYERRLAWLQNQSGTAKADAIESTAEQNDDEEEEPNASDLP